MRLRRYIYLICVVTALAVVGCTGRNGSETNHVAQPEDTVYTIRAAMSIYGYQPIRALQIIDSALIVGNISDVQADQCRARIYSMSLMKEQLDSLLGGSQYVRLDTALAIGERLLRSDTIKADLLRKKDVLEVMAYSERMRNDTIGWMLRSGQLVEVCRQIGADAATDALRTEAEIGAALCAIGQEKAGLAKLDSAINQLNSSLLLEDKTGGFNELDALIIALKRKITYLGAHNRNAETLPLARRIIECLDDYEQRPHAYHDGSLREPKNAQKRDDYINFYRNQAQNIITAAYASLGGNGNMLFAYELIERIVRDATAREHLARYSALQQQIEVERLKNKTNKVYQTAVTVGILALLAIIIVVILIHKNRTISLKNHLLAQQIAESINHISMYREEKRAQEPKPEPDPDTLTDEQLFQHINEVIVRERLYLSPGFGRKAIINRFNLSKERVGAIFNNGNEHTRLNSYIQRLRLDYSAKLLVEQPDKNIHQIATESGFSTHTYFSGCFRQHYGISPTEFRLEAQNPK